MAMVTGLMARRGDCFEGGKMGYGRLWALTPKDMAERFWSLHTKRKAALASAQVKDSI